MRSLEKSMAGNVVMNVASMSKTNLCKRIIILSAVTSFGFSLFLCGLYLGIAEGVENDALRLSNVGISFSRGWNVYEDVSLRYCFISLGLSTLIVSVIVHSRLFASIVGTISLLFLIMQSWILLTLKPASMTGGLSKYANLFEILWYFDFVVPAISVLLVVEFVYFIWLSGENWSEVAKQEKL